MAEVNSRGGKAGWWRGLGAIGPGLAVAATGVGAGDVVAATVSGARFGTTILWAVLLGALLKFALNEGIARWQLATGQTALEGWCRRLGRSIGGYFLAYLVLWSWIVSAGVLSACGLAGHALLPQLSVPTWAILHALAAALLALRGNYARFETTMKILVGLMFVCIVGTAVLLWPGTAAVLRGLVPQFPPGSATYLMSVIGGVGGSVTLLAYNYWVREKGWEGAQRLGAVRLDLGVAYILTGLFGAALVLLAGSVLHPAGIRVEGREGVVEMAQMLGGPLGPAGTWIFKLGFWAAVFTSAVGVFQGVPYLFADLVRTLRRDDTPPRTRSLTYRAYLAFLTLGPIPLFYIGKPVAVIITYTVFAALFMPFLAATLLVMNRRKDWMGKRLVNGPWANAALIAALGLFGYLAVQEAMRVFGR